MHGDTGTTRLPSPQLLEEDLGHEVMSRSEKLPRFQVEPSEVQAELEHSIAFVFNFPTRHRTRHTTS